jgi:DNA-binding HxlR family transcriptional regulator
MKVVLRRTYDNQVCSVARTLELVGERWTLLIVRDALMGVSRFGEFRRRLGVTASVLAGRLDRLAAAGVVERVPYQSRPTRYEYHLTSKGQELMSVVLSLMQWGDRHLTDEHGPPRTVRHRDCGGVVETRLRCRGCAAEPAPGEILTQSRPPVPALRT